jgi:hypothetical protein
MAHGLHVLLEPLHAQSDGFEGLAGEVKGPHFGDAIAEFNFIGKGFVGGDGGIPSISHAPLIDTELGDGSGH